MRGKKKKRANKYEKKLKVNATFDEILTLMVTSPRKKTIKKKENGKPK